jgi:hypothetical protein
MSSRFSWSSILYLLKSNEKEPKKKSQEPKKQITKDKSQEPNHKNQKNKSQKTNRKTQIRTKKEIRKKPNPILYSFGAWNLSFGISSFTSWCIFINFARKSRPWHL